MSDTADTPITFHARRANRRYYIMLQIHKSGAVLGEWLIPHSDAHVLADEIRAAMSLRDKP